MSPFNYQPRRVDNSAIPTAIFGLLIANGLVYALSQLKPALLFGYFALWPLASPNPEFHVWQLLTYGFLHDLRGLAHIGFNMFGLWMFGRDIERVMGAKRFLIYYLTCVVGAGIVQLIVAGTQGGVYPTVGASGGVFGILLAFGMTFPNRMVMLLFPPIPMKAKNMVIVFGLMELYFGASGRSPGVANFAHLGGMLFGFLLIQYWRNQRAR
jgi:membrane associated rhomboid family serine protease